MSTLSPRALWSLVLLACAAFAYNTSESLPVGLLPQMSKDLGVSEASIGGLLTSYAIVVAVSVVPLVVMLSAVARRRLILVTIGVLVVSNLAMAVAPSYELVVVARLLSAATHGIFWSVVAPTAVMLVPRGREGFATAIAFTGSSLAMVLGTPLTTAIGTLLGWRIATGLLASMAALAFVGLALVLPALPVSRSGSAQAANVWKSFVSTARSSSLVVLCLATIALVTAYFAAYTYIALFVRRYTGLEGTGLSVVLLVFGLAGVISVWIVGKVTDRRPKAAAFVCTAALGAAFLGIGVFSSWAPAGVIGSIVLLGAAFSATPVFLQAVVLRVSPKSGDVASSIYVVAFQIGIAGGAHVGGLAVNNGLIDIVPWIAVVAVGIGMLLLLRERWAFVRAPIGVGEELEETMTGGPQG